MKILSFRFPDSRTPASKTLVEQLFREVHQTETSALKHCPREARRLGDSPAAVILCSIAEHAEGARVELRNMAKAMGLPDGDGTTRPLGALFSLARVSVLDQLMPLQLSYRGTLLGLRHGVDLMMLLRSAALMAENAELVTWCDRWLATRVPLVDLATRELAWLAEHADVAVTRPPLLRSLFARPRASS